AGAAPRLVTNAVIRLTIIAMFVGALVVPTSSAALATNCTSGDVPPDVQWAIDPVTGAPAMTNGRARIVGTVLNRCDVGADVEVDVKVYMHTADACHSP